MSTLYYFNAHNTVLANSDIDDTVQAEDPVALNGSFIVRVPFGVRLVGNPPTTLAGLELQKYRGLLALYPGFTNITYNELVDATGFTPASQSGVTLGSRGSISILNGGLLETDMAVLLSTPSECVVVWEAFKINLTNPPLDRFIRTYEEVDASLLTVSASFDNGANFTTVSDGALTSISPLVQGNQFILRFANASGARLWLGSWAVIY